MLYADLGRLFVGTALLMFASYTDWRWRRAPNVLWLVMAGAGLGLLGLEALVAWESLRASWYYLLFVPVFVGLMYGFWYMGLIAGGADAKALMALALLLPFPLAMAPVGSPLPGAFAVLGNSLVAFLVIPLAYGAWNLLRGNFHLPAMFLGVQRPVARLGEGHYWPMERVVEGERRLFLNPSRLSDAELAELRQALTESGAERVWVTPKVPFMIPLLAGFLLTFTVGDVLFALIGRVAGA